jgi:hypothetical protein
MSWTGKGKYFKPLGAVWSSNPEKAERTIKKTFNSYQKRTLAKVGAKRYYRD